MNASGQTSASSTGSKGSAFRKPSYKRSVAILSASGIVFGLGLSGSGPAKATTPADCAGNTVTPATTGTTEEKEVANLLNISGKIRDPNGNGIVCLDGHFDVDGQIYLNRHAKVYGLGTSSITSPYGTVFQSDRDSNNEIAFDIEINNLSILDSPGTAVYARNVVINNGSTLSGNISPGGGGAIRAERNVTISNSTLGGNIASGQNGGAILAEGNVTISNSTLTGNRAIDGNGGAIYAGGNVTIISNSSLTSNTVGYGNGGAIDADGNVTISNSSLTGNTATWGGAISASGSVSIESTSSLLRNEATDHGGAIEAVGNVSISGSTVSLNTSGNGGAIYAYSLGGVTVSNSTLSENEATLSGGAIWTDGAVAVSSNSTLSANSSLEDGGAINAGGNVSISGSTLSGNAARDGGAIFSYGNTLISISSNSTLSQNTATGEGGAISADGELAISDSTLSGNTSDSNGGAIFSDGNLTVLNSTFSGNSADTNGGAVWALTDSTFSNTTLSGNSAISNGGAVYVHGGGAPLSLSNSILTENSADNDGGAVFSYSQIDVVDSRLSRNTAGSDGGAVYNQSSTTLADSTFSDNSAEGNGGAIWGYGIITATSSTFTTNSALNGGAIYGDYFEGGVGSVSLSNATFKGNQARGLGSGSEGGAIFAHNGEVFFSTFVNNTASTPPDEPGDTPGNSIYKTGTGEFEIGANIFAGDSEHPQLGAGSSPTHFTDLGGNLFSTSSSDETDIAQDPDLDPELQLKHETSVFDKNVLSIFGTSTPALRTYLPNSSGTQLLGLAAGSPALSIVLNIAPFNSFTQDQRGTSRTFPASAGAFEGVAPVTPPPPPPPTTTPTPIATPTSNTSTTATASTLAKTGIVGPLWLGMTAGLVTALGSIAAGVSYKLRRRTK